MAADRDFTVTPAEMAEAALAVASCAMLALASKGILSKSEAAGALRSALPRLQGAGAGLVLEQLAETIEGNQSGGAPRRFTVYDGGKKD